MKLNVKNEVLDNIITTTISVEELGNATYDADTEAEYLNDYVTTFQYSDIDFTQNMKLSDGGMPVATDDEADGETVAEITVKNLINKSYRLSEDMVVTFTVNVENIDDSELVAPFTSKALMGQAYATVFANKVIEIITDKLDGIRSLENTFEGETTTII